MYSTDIGSFGGRGYRNRKHIDLYIR